MVERDCARSDQPAVPCVVRRVYMDLVFPCIIFMIRRIDAYRPAVRAVLRAFIPLQVVLTVLFAPHRELHALDAAPVIRHAFGRYIKYSRL